MHKDIKEQRKQDPERADGEQMNAETLPTKTEKKTKKVLMY